MKKTLALLIATTTAVFAATPVTFEEASQSYTNEFAVALTLDLSFLTSQETTYFTIGGANADPSVSTTPSVGLGFDAYYGEHSSMLNGAFDSKIYTEITTEERYITLVYNYSYSHDEAYDVYNTSFTLSMYRWNENGELIGDPFVKTATRKGNAIGSLSSYEINEQYVKSSELYLSNLGTDEIESVAVRLKDALFSSDGGDTPGTDTTVPEPATATLSLLALAGLAARRRRK